MSREVEIEHEDTFDLTEEEPQKQKAAISREVEIELEAVFGSTEEEPQKRSGGDVPTFCVGRRVLIKLHEGGVKTSYKSTIVGIRRKKGKKIGKPQAYYIVYDNFCELYEFDPKEDEYEDLTERIDMIKDPRIKRLGCEMRRIWAICSAFKIYSYEETPREDAEGELPDKMKLGDCLNVVYSAQELLLGAVTGGEVDVDGVNQEAKQLEGILDVLKPAIRWSEEMAAFVDAPFPEEPSEIYRKMEQGEQLFERARLDDQHGFPVIVDTSKLEVNLDHLSWVLEASQVFSDAAPAQDAPDTPLQMIEFRRLKQLVASGKTNGISTVPSKNIMRRLEDILFSANTWERGAAECILALKNGRCVDLKVLEGVIERAKKCAFPKNLRLPGLERAQQAMLTVQKRDDIYAEFLSAAESPNLLDCFRKFENRLRKLEDKVNIVSEISTKYGSLKEEIVFLQEAKSLETRLETQRSGTDQGGKPYNTRDKNEGSAPIESQPCSKEELETAIKNGLALSKKQALSTSSQHIMERLQTELQNVKNFEARIEVALSDENIPFKNVQLLIEEASGLPINMTPAIKILTRRLLFLQWDAEASALISGANSKESSISTESLMAVEAFVQEISALIKQDGKDTDTMLLSFFQHHKVGEKYRKMKSIHQHAAMVNEEGGKYLQGSPPYKLRILNIKPERWKLEAAEKYLTEAAVYNVESAPLEGVKTAVGRVKSWESRALELLSNLNTYSCDAFSDLIKEESSLKFESNLFLPLQCRFLAVEWASKTENEFTGILRLSQSFDARDAVEGGIANLGFLQQQYSVYNTALKKVPVEDQNNSNAENELRGKLYKVYVNCTKALWLIESRFVYMQAERPTLAKLNALKDQFEPLKSLGTSSSDSEIGEAFERISTTIKASVEYREKLRVCINLSNNDLGNALGKHKRESKVSIPEERDLWIIFKAREWISNVETCRSQSYFNNLWSNAPEFKNIKGSKGKVKSVVQQIQAQMKRIKKSKDHLDRVDALLRPEADEYRAKFSLQQMDTFSLLYNSTPFCDFENVKLLAHFVQDIKRIDEKAENFATTTYEMTSEESVNIDALNNLQKSISKLKDDLQQNLLRLSSKSAEVSLQRSTDIIGVLKEREEIREALESKSNSPKLISVEKLERVITNTKKFSILVNPKCIKKLLKKVKKFREASATVLLSSKALEKHISVALKKSPEHVILNENLYLESFRNEIKTGLTTKMKKKYGSSLVIRKGTSQARWIKYRNYPYWPGRLIPDALAKAEIKGAQANGCNDEALSKSPGEGNMLAFLCGRKYVHIPREKWRLVPFSENEPNHPSFLSKCASFKNAIDELKLFVVEEKQRKRSRDFEDEDEGLTLSDVFSEDSEESDESDPDYPDLKKTQEHRKKEEPDESDPDYPGPEKTQEHHKKRRKVQNPTSGNDQKAFILKMQKENFCNLLECALDMSKERLRGEKTAAATNVLARNIERSLHAKYGSYTDGFDKHYKTLKSNLKENAGLRNKVLLGDMSVEELTALTPTDFDVEVKAWKKKLATDKLIEASSSGGFNKASSPTRTRPSTEAREKETTPILSEEKNDEGTPILPEDEDDLVQVEPKRSVAKKRSANDGERSGESAKRQRVVPKTLVWKGSVKMKRSGSIKCEIHSLNGSHLSPAPMELGSILTVKGRLSIHELNKMCSRVSTKPFLGYVKSDDSSGGLSKFCKPEKPAAYIKVEGGIGGQLYLVNTKGIDVTQIYALKNLRPESLKHSFVAVLVSNSRSGRRTSRSNSLHSSSRGRSQSQTRPGIQSAKSNTDSDQGNKLQTPQPQQTPSMALSVEALQQSIRAAQSAHVPQHSHNRPPRGVYPRGIQPMGTGGHAPNSSRQFYSQQMYGHAQHQYTQQHQYVQQHHPGLPRHAQGRGRGGAQQMLQQQQRRFHHGPGVGSRGSLHRGVRGVPPRPQMVPGPRRGAPLPPAYQPPGGRGRGFYNNPNRNMPAWMTRR